MNRASWSGGKRTSAEVSASTSSNPDHSRFNMVSVWPPGPFSPVPVGRSGIVGLSERSGYLDYQKRCMYVRTKRREREISPGGLKGLHADE